MFRTPLSLENRGALCNDGPKIARALASCLTVDSFATVTYRDDERKPIFVSSRRLGQQESDPSPALDYRANWLLKSPLSRVEQTGYSK